MFELSQTFHFDAAHTLKRAVSPEEAAGSRRIHGHTYHAELTLEDVPGAKKGMLVDLGVVRQEIETIRDLLDHRFLDEIAGLGPATLENLCRFIFAQLASRLPALTKVSVERQASGDRCCLSA